MHLSLNRMYTSDGFDDESGWTQCLLICLEDYGSSVLGIGPFASNILQPKNFGYRC